VTNVIFIEARAGSTRLPKKHLLLIDGHPVIRHVMDAARESALATDVIVSSNCPDIQQIARESGLECYDREAHLCHEEGNLNDQNAGIVKWNSDRWMKANGQVGAFAAIRLMGCSLIMDSSLIDEVIMAMNSGATRARTMYRAEQDHPFYACEIERDGLARYVNRKMPIRSNEMPEMYIVDGGPLGDRVVDSVADAFVPVISQKGDVIEIHDANSYELAKGLWESRNAMHV
jgi:CMP-N-acetylneuraminic acid synthetase